MPIVLNFSHCKAIGNTKREREQGKDRPELDRTRGAGQRGQEGGTGKGFKSRGAGNRIVRGGQAARIGGTEDSQDRT
jgi:hypothetical protein